MALEKIKRHPDYQDSQDAINLLQQDLEKLLGKPEYVVDGEPHKSYAEMFLDSFETCITTPAQAARLLVLLKAITEHENAKKDPLNSSPRIMQLAATNLTNQDHPIYTLPLFFLARNQASFNGLLNKFGLTAFVGISEIAVMNQKDFKSYMGTINRNEICRDKVRDCLVRNQEPIDNLNQLRHYFGLPLILPEGILYPGADSNEPLSPELQYTLEDSDIYLGIQLLQQNPVFKNDWFFQKGQLVFCLMPIVHSVTFHDGEPDPESFVQMGATLCNLLSEDKARPLIAGILRVDNNHYINFFISKNPNDGIIQVFILDPSAEKKQGEKAKKELKYAGVFRNLLGQGFDLKKIVLEGCSVTQQLREKDCGFLCVQNLEDVLIKGDVFFLDEDSNLVFDARRLTVNGNPGSGYDPVKQLKYYPETLERNVLELRAKWAGTFKKFETVTYYQLSESPTLRTLVQGSFEQRPYSYETNLRVQYQREVHETVIATFRQELESWPYTVDKSYMGYWVDKFSTNFDLPTINDLEHYCRNIKSRYHNRFVSSAKFTMDDINKQIAPLEQLIQQFVVDALNVESLGTFGTHFLLFKETYVFPADAESLERIYEDFLNQEKIKAFFALPGAKSKKEVFDHLTREYDKEIKEGLLQTYKAIEGEKLAQITQTQSMEKLREWSMNLELLFDGVQNGKVILSLLKEQISKAIIVQINRLAKACIEQTLQDHSRGKSLTELLAIGEEKWRAEVLQSKSLDFVRQFSIEAVLTKKIDTFYNGCVDGMLAAAIDTLVQNEAFNLARLYPQSERCDARIVAIFNTKVLGLKKHEKGTYNVKYLQSFIHQFRQKLEGPCKLFEEIWSEFPLLSGFCGALDRQIRQVVPLPRMQSISVPCQIFTSQLNAHHHHLGLMQKSKMKLINFTKELTSLRDLRYQELKIMLQSFRYLAEINHKNFKDSMQSLISSDDFKRLTKDENSKSLLMGLINEVLTEEPEVEKTSSCVIF